MERFRRLLGWFPAWLFSLITACVILWLTLAPKPLGDNPPELFPGADKIAHGLMFGFLSLMISLDYERKHRWKPISIWLLLLIGTLCLSFGALIEVLQLSMGLGRSFEWEDIIADLTGIVICLSMWCLIENGKTASGYGKK